MNIKDLTFKTPLDIADLFKEEKNVTIFLTEFFDNCHTFYNKTNGNYIPIIRNEATGYYNIDHELLLYSFMKYLDGLGLERNALASAKNLFSKLDKGLSKKSTVFLLNVLSFYEVTSQPKGGFYYLAILGKRLDTETYFEFNSVGINRIAILEFLGKEFETNFIMPIAGNIKTVSVVGMSLKGISKSKKEFGIMDSNIYSLANIIREETRSNEF